MWENSVLPAALARMRVHLYHGLDYAIPFVKTPFIKVSTVHDATGFTEHDGRPWVSKLRVRLLSRAVARSADLLFTDSMFSEHEIQKYLHVSSGRIQVAWVGIADAFYRPCVESAVAQVATKLNGCDDYILYYGGFRKHKNVEGLLRAYSLISSRVQSRLVLVGRPGQCLSELDPLIQQLNLHDRLVFFGFASEEELKCLLQECRLFVFPSLMEGFGLPLAEALACGAPVVCSNAASLPEVGGDAALYFDPSASRSVLTRCWRF